MKTSGTHTLLHKTVLLAAVGTALYFVLTTLIGMVNSYTPVPYWDMWGGTLGFYIAHRDGDISIWWSQHNEHRIVLSRILFWLDYTLFSGNSVFLFVINAVLACISIALFYLFSRDLLAANFSEQRQRLQFPLRVFTALICAWLFQWMQDQNFAWAFQSQFFLAQLVPLVAFYLLSRAVNAGAVQRFWFIAACVAGVASAGTMANGILALPLMTLYALAIRQPRARVGVLAVMSLLTVFLYFFDYASPVSHGAGEQSAFSQPLLWIHYAFLYLGTPFYMLFGEDNAGLTAALIATSVIAVVSITLLIVTLRDLWRHKQPTEAAQAITLALVFYIIYLVGTAFGTGSGRLIFGVSQALQPRYTTPALMAWAAVFILLLPLILRHWRAARWALMPAGLGLLLLMIILQWQALDPRHDQVFSHEVAGLALELDIRDQAQINVIYEMSDGLLNVANIASRYDLTMFGMTPWHNLRELPGRASASNLPAPQQLPACLGHIDKVSRIPGESRFFSVEGWMVDPVSQADAGLIEAQTIDGIVSGFGLSGYSRPDVAAAINVEAIQTGFKAYLRTQDSGQPLWLIADGGSCALQVNTTLPD